MKIIHTSDWHLGQEFYSFDRTEEHVAFFSQLKDIVVEEQPDVLVVSGDIFHNATPSNSVMRLFTDHLDAICRAHPGMTVVIIAGNHDSSSRVEISRTLWEHFHVFIIGKLEKKDKQLNFDQHIIPVVASSGELKGYVVALPYVTPLAFPSVEDDIPREKRQAAFLEVLSHKLNEKNLTNAPVVMMAHMAITGCDATGHNLTQGGMDYINVADLKVGFDYLALGHIHCPQKIKTTEAGVGYARYSGSPIPVSFDEHYVHSVTVVEISQHGEQPLVRTIPIHNPWPLLTIPKEAVDFEEGLSFLEKLPADQQSYIRLHVKLTDVPPQNAMERAIQAVKGKKCRFCCFKWEETAKVRTRQRYFIDVDQMKAHSPLEIAELYYESKFGVPLDNEYKKMLSDVILRVQQQDK